MTWAALHHYVRNQVQYPDENVARFLTEYLQQHPDNQPTVLLDIGCGAGRHLRLARDLGYDATGVDIEADMLAGDQIIRGDMRDLPINDNSVDVAIAVGTIYYTDFDGLTRAVNEIHRVLGPGGRTYFNLRTPMDTRHLGHDEPTHQIERPEVEKGLTATFVDFRTLENLVAPFASYAVAVQTLAQINAGWMDSHWLIAATK